MQTSELEKKKNHLLGDEECINFRPSPNFKHMRKYLKSKFEEANSSPNQSSDPSTTPNSEEQDTVKPSTGTSSSMAQRVQPPLPPNSPPPELVIPKQEIEDDEYNDRPPQASPQTAKEDVADKPTKTMCRQFIRGACSRGAACIYVHEVILNQLPGVYTFCKNFQNKECKLAKCKFVHATVFEKEHFYRTGFLPPHTLGHLKESNSALAPASSIEDPAEAAQMFTNPPPSMLPGLSSLPTSACAPDGRTNPDVFANGHTALKTRSPAKRDWAEIELAMAAHDIDCKEPKPKKCKSCDVNELRVQCSKATVEKLEHQIDMYKQQKIQLNKWGSKLEIVLDLVLKANNIVGPSVANRLNSTVTRSDQDTFDQMSLFFQVSNRLNGIDSSQKLLLRRFLKDLLDEKSSELRHASPISR